MVSLRGVLLFLLYVLGIAPVHQKWVGAVFESVSGYRVHRSNVSGGVEAARRRRRRRAAAAAAAASGSDFPGFDALKAYFSEPQHHRNLPAPAAPPPLIEASRGQLVAGRLRRVMQKHVDIRRPLRFADFVADRTAEALRECLARHAKARRRPRFADRYGLVLWTDQDDE
jgi:hypothetical protein